MSGQSSGRQRCSGSRRRRGRQPSREARRAAPGQQPVPHAVEVGQAKHREAFVAMWFAGAMLPVFVDAIAPALDATGYDPFRSICVRITRNRRPDRGREPTLGSLVADFTGHRGGAYWKAGFAQGLGIRCACRTVREHSSAAARWTSSA